ncbi:MAG: peptidoglycan D,D-transpeptidase FtsI family protein [Rhizobiaceae bacterium]
MIDRFFAREPKAAGAAIDSYSKVSGDRTRNRIMIAMACFAAIYGTIGARLVYFGLQDNNADYTGSVMQPVAARPDLVDRNGEILATDIKTASLFAEPKRIIDADETLEMLTSIIPDLDQEQTYRKLKSGLGFIWLRRQMTPKQQAQVMALGLPGIGFRSEKQRFYPGGPTASHIVGLVDVDNKGTAGMEKYVDAHGLSDLHAAGFNTEKELEPVKLSIDLRVQHIVRDELEQAMVRYRSIAAGAVVMDVHSGEVIAMASLPDYDPNNPFNALEKDRLNRMSAGTFEMGSTFKTFTTAMALDSGKVTLKSKFDATRPIQIARFTINDFHGKRRVLTVPEIFIYSSNIGTAKMADAVGTEGHREFLHRIGLLSKMQTELPEVARPTEPKEWKKLHSITISFGHGASTTPLQTAVAAAALVNGGKLIQPTFIPRTREEADGVAVPVIKEETSEAMRWLFRKNVIEGSGKRAAVPGYDVGGKTGTAEKVVGGRYSSDKRFNAFLSAFPMRDPKYVVLVILDEPKPEAGKGGATAGSNTAPTVGAIIQRSAAFLGVQPDFSPDNTPLASSQR